MKKRNHNVLNKYEFMYIKEAMCLRNNLIFIAVTNNCLDFDIHLEMEIFLRNDFFALQSVYLFV